MLGLVLLVITFCVNMVADAAIRRSAVAGAS
jgi:ABC-type phosphate transport system permease subunit